ncbi:sulfite exporter TauE/SafE family protein [Microbacterium excoecariae]|uniref:sulfite exporter TauE/SafE family protein n=1 Tax=Microbacterium excoecariae TaxID=2715210 RepID=UPI001407445F|nr:sulfite exporter TauE/SafE family protein [Microbacterium excoecariae]NHI17732.1 sulfite exporter TauE/SafE family protein [Microbacterium excoecariae]
MDWATLLTEFNWPLAIAAVGIGVVVGLTGMGGGALMTPLLVLGFGVSPLTAVSSDLITSAVMKPAGSIVHARHGTVDWRIVGWLALGSVPAAFAGALIIAAVGELTGVQAFVKTALGAVLLIAAALLGLRAFIGMRNRARERRYGTSTRRSEAAEIRVRPIPTLIIGVVGGLMVGLTSVGSGSFIIITLMLMYPLLSMNRLVGTDLVQAVPLVIAAAIGHLLFGDVDWSIVIPLTIGSVPGAILGARMSSLMPGGIVRRALALVLLAAGLRMLNVDLGWTIAAVSLGFVAATVGWMGLRRANGLEATYAGERKVAGDDEVVADSPR